MKNIHLTSRTTEDIDRRISRLLSDLGNPEPPIRLPDVRELLRLDLHYYSSADEGLFREFVHKMTIGGKQIAQRPSLILDVIREFSLKAIFLPDRRRILIDDAIPDAKKRWNEGHEIVHSILPWHNELMLGDTSLTLSPACHEQIEAEANYGNGQLLFLRTQFDELILDSPASLGTVKVLKERFGNTMSSTLWRYVEQSPNFVFGVICDPPHHLSSEFDPASPIRHFITSKAFEGQFKTVSEQDIFEAIKSYAKRARGGPLGSAEVVLRDDSGVDHIFAMETFSNTYDALTLGVQIGKRALVA